MSDSSDAPQQLSVLAIHAAKCLKCTRLVSWASTTYSCNAPGNPHCPAQCVKIVLGFNIDDVAQKIHASMVASDLVETTRLLNKLSQHDTHIQQRVMQLVTSMQAKIKSGD